MHIVSVKEFSLQLMLKCHRLSECQGVTVAESYTEGPAIGKLQRP